MPFEHQINMLADSKPVHVFYWDKQVPNMDEKGFAVQHKDPEKPGVELLTIYSVKSKVDMQKIREENIEQIDVEAELQKLLDKKPFQERISPANQQTQYVIDYPLIAFNQASSPSTLLVSYPQRERSD